MTSSSSKTTAYSEYVFSNLPLAMAVGQGLYNYKEAAELVGLKPTQHFKRRVRDLVKQCKLKCVPCFSPANRIEMRFQYDERQVNGDRPF